MGRGGTRPYHVPVGMASTPSLIRPLVFRAGLSRVLVWDAVDLAVGDASLPCFGRDGVFSVGRRGSRPYHVPNYHRNSWIVP
jgi:hypothetical protein